MNWAWDKSITHEDPARFPAARNRNLPAKTDSRPRAWFARLRVVAGVRHHRLFDFSHRQVYRGAFAESEVVFPGVGPRRSDFAVRLRRLRRAGLHVSRSEEHTSELQSRQYLVCRL